MKPVSKCKHPHPTLPSPIFIEKNRIECTLIFGEIKAQGRNTRKII
jgi:hypothetical protein